MAEQKIFAGPRIRRLRRQMALTQTAMAAGLGISPSYLNLIERNQRPLTVQLLLKLASAYGIEPESLQGEGGPGLTALREVFSDPLLSAELPGDQELKDFLEVTPNAAGGMVKLYRAYREQRGRLSDLSGLLAEKGHATALSAAALPADEVRGIFEARPYHFPALEDAALAFREELDPGNDLPAALGRWFGTKHGIAVRTLPADAMPLWRRRFDRHSMRLFLSERLAPAQRLLEMAVEAVLLHAGRALVAELDGLKLTGDEARRLARFELARYAALALMMPYAPFLAAAQRTRYDVETLSSRFHVGFEQAATRLIALRRPGAAGIPFLLMEVDNAGNILRRYGAGGSAHSVFGECPRLCVYAAFSQPDRMLAERVEMPDGTILLTLARTLRGLREGVGQRVRRTALLLACDFALAGGTVYGEAAAAAAPVTAGPACRICERQGCPSRAAPPVTRPLGLDQTVAGLSAFDFQ